MKRITFKLWPSPAPLEPFFGWIRWWRKKPLKPGRYTAHVRSFTVQRHDHITVVLDDIKEAK